MTTTFESARVGDEVECLLHGKGVIEKIVLSDPYPIRVRMITGKYQYYTVTGSPFADRGRTLFWPGVKVIAPEEPKRTVRKEIVLWMNSYKYGETIWRNVYNTKAEALEAHKDSLYMLMAHEPVELKGWIEVEE